MEFGRFWKAVEWLERFLGLISPLLVSYATDRVTVFTPWSVVLAFGISGVTGIIFGIYPASQAAEVDPIDALPHE